MWIVCPSECTCDINLLHIYDWVSWLKYFFCSHLHQAIECSSLDCTVTLINTFSPGAMVMVRMLAAHQGLWSVALPTVFWRSCCSTSTLQPSTWNSWSHHPTSHDAAPSRPPPKMSSSFQRWCCLWWRNTSGEVQCWDGEILWWRVEVRGEQSEL